jgi:hypothetical protein
MRNSHCLGHKIYCKEPDEEFPYDNWRFCDTDESIYNHNRKCPKCLENETQDGHDPCIKNLPGVRFACCGHGEHEGYIMFDNGTLVRGIFKIERGY